MICDICIVFIALYIYHLFNVYFHELQYYHF